MEDLLTTTQYPLVPFTHKVSLSEYQSDFLKSAFTDFRITIYSNKINGPVFGYLTLIRAAGTAVQVGFDFKAKTINDSHLKLICTLTLDFDSTFSSSNSALTGFVRAHFDNTDCVFVATDAITAIDGYACFVGLHRWKDVFSSLSLQESNIMLEPATISVIGNHRVESFACQFAKPLIIQAENLQSSTYSSLSAPVTGNVNFIAGNNCIITLSPISNSLLISAVRNANNSPEELCGVWKDKVPESTKDVLCNEAVYSLGGAYPDDGGNIAITGQYPITVSTRAKDDLPDSPKAAVSSNSGLNHIERFIYVGTVARELESVCEPPTIETCN
jgi:hypothetical protein